MDADEVYKALTDRQNRHEDKCDQRQAALHAKMDHLEKVVYIGIGLMVAISAIAEAGLLQGIFGR